MLVLAAAWFTIADAQRRFAAMAAARDEADAIAAALRREIDAREPVKRGRPKASNPKEAVNLRLSPKVLEHFRATGRGWQTRINDALRAAKV